MADLPAASADTMEGALFATATTYYLSLHSANPGTTGASEISGGSYARQAITFAAASGGVQSSNDAQSFTNMPAEASGVYPGVWTAATGGTYLVGGATAAYASAINAGDTVDFASGAVSFTVS